MKKNLFNTGVSVPSPGMTEHQPRELFREIFQGARISSLPPSNCIPYVKIRKISESGVRRLMLSYRGEETGGAWCNGISTTGNIPMVVPLVGDQADYAEEYFKTEHSMNKSQAKLEASKFKTWYGIIEGAHRNEALWRLAAEDPGKYLSISWTVLVLQPRPVQFLRGFCRNLMDKQREKFFVAATLFDSIASLQDDVRSMRTLNPDREISVNALCSFAMGVEKRASETMRILAKRALSLSTDVVQEIGKLLNSEEPDISYSRAAKGTPKDTLDCRVFRKTIVTSTFRTSRSFFNNADPKLVVNQICALKRVKEFSRANDFRTVTGAKLDELYIGAKKAIREIEKFEAVLDGDPWPTLMQAAKTNILHTSLFDADISLNDGNDSTILPHLEELYKQCCPAFANMKISKWRRSFQLFQESEPPASPVRSNTVPVLTDDNPQEDELSDQTEKESTDVNGSEDPISRFQDRLKEVGVSVLPVSPDEYSRNVLTPDSEPSFDFVLTEIPHCVTSEDACSVLSICKRVLKPGSSFFAFVPWKSCHIWHEKLLEAGFSVMDHPFVMTYRTTKVQKTRTICTPQQAAFFAIVAFAPGRRLDGFSPDLKTPYTKISCSHKRKFAIIDDVVPPVRPLTRSNSKIPLVKTERNVNMLCEIMTTFAPGNAAVFDPFGGPLTTACAALLSGRQCTVLQKSEDILAVALQRLVAIAEAGVCSRSLRSKNQEDRVRERAMFDMYNDMRQSEFLVGREAERSESSDDESVQNFDATVLSPLTPAQRKSGMNGSQLVQNLSCYVQGCLNPNNASQSRTTGRYGHTCASCQLPVHILCCTRVLGISVEDSDTPLFCTSCYNDENSIPERE